MNDKHIIIILLCIIVALLCVGIGYLTLNKTVEYNTINLVENGTTIEIPKDMALKSNNNGIQVFENDNTIVISFNSADRSADEALAFGNIKNPIFGNADKGNVTMKDPTVAGCSLSGECNAVYVSNNGSSDNVIVIGKDSNILNHILKSIKWHVPPSNDDDEDTSQTVSSGPSAYAYKSDGTPMYSQAEVNRYMQNKYGDVNYHVGSNGYIDMDEPGYDDAGHWIGR